MFTLVIVLICFFIARNFSLIGSVDDHSAAVTSTKLTCNGSKILSSSEDRWVPHKTRRFLIVAWIRYYFGPQFIIIRFGDD